MKLSAEELETVFDDVRDGLGRGDQFSDSQAYKAARPALRKVEAHIAALESDLENARILESALKNRIASEVAALAISEAAREKAEEALRDYPCACVYDNYREQKVTCARCSY